MIQYVEND